MAITSAFWSFADGDFQGYDIHVLAGQTSRTLNDILTIKDGVEPAATFKLASENGGHPFDTTTRFVGEFAGAPGPAHTVKKLDATTGEVEINAALPSTRLFNFLLRAEVTLPPAGPPPVVFGMTPRIRVHVHRSVVRAWLSPIPLSIHRGSNGHRFSVLAEFDDGTIGDISRLPGIAWGISAGSANTNPDGTPKFTVDPGSGALSAHVDNGNVTVEARLPTGWGGHLPSAGLNALPPWSTPQPATLVAGPGRSKMNEAMNYLFLSEGFGPGEDHLFTRMVLEIVTSLRKDTRLSPYSVLKDSINYWMAWIGSRFSGASVVYEVNERADGRGRKRWTDTPPALKPADPPAPPAPAPSWRGDEVFHEVGLPVPADAIPAGTTPAAIVTLWNAQKVRWEALYGSKVAGRIDQAGFENWCSWADRRLIDEQDTALSLAVGGRPRHEYRKSTLAALWHPLRTKRADVDAMLRELTDGPGGPTIGGVWGDPNGKDRPFVCALLGGTRYVAFASGDLLSVSVIPQGDVLVRPSGPRALGIDPYPPPTPLPPAVVWTVAHETAHHLGLGDEYAGPGTLPAGAAGGIAPVPNLQDLDSLSNPPPSPPTPQVRTLDGGKLKWRWHRIEKAGVLKDPPTADGPGKFKVPMKPGHAGHFKLGDEILLRPRSLAVASASSLSVPLKVEAVAPGLLKVKALAGSGQSPLTFPALSIVYVPLKSAVTGTPLLIVASKILDHLTASGQPLNAATGSPRTRPCDPLRPYSGYQPGKNLPAGLTLKPGVHKGWIVGAYEGGTGFQCGIYHPAGACMMSENKGEQDPTDPPVTSTDPRVDYLIRDKAYPFCPICRYVIVDAVDPTRHKSLDDWYRNSGRYPE